MAKSDKPLVLVADDEPSTLALVASHLRGRGYRVIEASDGDDAWDKACRELPDLVVLDVMMPGMSGWEVCRKIREAVSLAHTGIIMLTGIGETLNELTSPLYGADAYLDKPFQFNQLAELVKGTLERRGTGALGRPAASGDKPAAEAQRRKTNGRPAARLWKSAQDEEKRHQAPRSQRRARAASDEKLVETPAQGLVKKAKKAVAKVTKKSPTKKAVAKVTKKAVAKVAKKSPAKKAKKAVVAKAKKAAAKVAKKLPTKKAPAKKAKKTPAKKAKKAPAKKAKKTPAKKSPVKKAPARSKPTARKPGAKKTGRKKVA